VVGAGAASPAGGEGPAAGATRDWGRAPQSAEDEQRRQEREDKLREASYAPEKIGRMSVVLCGIALLIGAISLVVLCFGVGTAGATATMGAQGQTHPGFAGGAIMSFGVCMFGFAPICAVCGFILGVHSVMRSRHDKLWGALGTGLNGILVIPFVIGCLMTLLSLHK
jgi:hypothetical protein